MNSLEDLFYQYVRDMDSKYPSKSFDIQNLFQVLSSCSHEVQVEQILTWASVFSSQKNPSQNRTCFFETIMESYDQILNEEDKLKFLLRIPEAPLFRKYAQKHYLLFEDLLNHSVLFDPSREMETFDLLDAQDILDRTYGKDTYHAFIHPFQFIDTSVLPFYQLFRHVTHFWEYKEIKSWDNMLFYSMSLSDLLQVLLITNEPNEKYIVCHLFFHDYHHKLLDIDWNYNEKEMKVILSSFSEYFANQLQTQKEYLSLKNIDASFLQKLEDFGKILFSLVQKISPEETIPHHVYDLSFWTSLLLLQKMPKQERKKTYLYLACYQVFLNAMLLHFQDPLRDRDLVIFEALFQRIIEGHNLFTILQIDQLKSLYHYFKTNEFLPKLSYITLEQIEAYSPKKYFQVREKFLQALRTNSFQNSYCIEDYCIFGYDFLMKLDIDFWNQNKKNIYQFLKGKDLAYYQTFLHVFTHFFEPEIAKSIPINNFLGAFDYLYQNHYPKITFKKIKKCADSLSYYLFPNNLIIQESLEKLNLVSKGEPLLEKLAGIKLYDQYRFRVYSSIPDYYGELGDYQYQMVDLHDPDILSNGIGKYYLPDREYASSCLTPNGKAASCLAHGATNVHGRFFKVTFNGQILAYSWVWRCGNILCFDNIEVTESLFAIPHYCDVLSRIYLKVSEEMIRITQSVEQRLGIQLVILGKNVKDLAIPVLDSLPKVNEYQTSLYQPNHQENLYLKDSEMTQIILAGTYHPDLSNHDVEPKYLYSRKKVQVLENFEEQEVLREIQSIYFDYCLEQNIRYEKFDVRDYAKIYLAEDFFIGVKNDGSKEFYSCGNDERRFREAETYMKLPVEKKKKGFAIGKSEQEKLRYLTDSSNYEIDPSLSLALPEFFDEKFIFDVHDYLHGTNPLTLGKIMLEKEITSSFYGEHSGGSGSNGNYYICVAKIKEDPFTSAYTFPSFVIDQNIFVMDHKFNPSFASYFRETKYPLRDVNYDNEYQVYKAISLDKAKAILVKNDYYILAQILYLQEFAGNTLPIVWENHKILKKEEVKKYLRLK